VSHHAALLQTIGSILSSFAKNFIAFKVSIVVSVDANAVSRHEDHAAIVSSDPAIAEENIVAKSTTHPNASRAATVQSSVTRVVTVYELAAFLKQVGPTAAASAKIMTTTLRE